MKYLKVNPPRKTVDSVIFDLGTEQEDRHDGFHSAAVGVARSGERCLSGDGGRGHLLPVGDDDGEKSHFHR